MAEGFSLLEATIADIHAAYRERRLTARQLVEMYLERIERFDRGGPKINALISLNPRALDEADRLDAAFRASGPVGPLHGIPVVIKDQADVKEMPTTLGSVLFKDHRPGRDCFVAAKLRQAGAIFIGKGTLGELGAGDTHGSLFGSTRNPLRSRAHRGRLVRRPGGERVGEFRDARGRAGGLRLDPPSGDLDGDRRHAADAPVSSAAAAFMAAGRRPMARSARWRAPSPISRSCSMPWSATIPRTR